MVGKSESRFDLNRDLTLNENRGFAYRCSSLLSLGSFGERVCGVLHVRIAVCVRILLTALNWADVCDITIYCRRPTMVSLHK